MNGFLQKSYVSVQDPPPRFPPSTKMNLRGKKKKKLLFFFFSLFFYILFG